MLKNSCAASYFYGKCDVLFSQCYIKNIFNKYIIQYTYICRKFSDAELPIFSGKSVISLHVTFW